MAQDKKITFPVEVEYPDNLGKLNSDQLQIMVSGAVVKLDRNNLAGALFTKDGSPKEDINISIYDILRARLNQPESNANQYHDCLRLVIRYTKMQGATELNKNIPRPKTGSKLRPLELLAQSPTQAEDLKVLVEEYGIENIDFKHRHGYFNDNDLYRDRERSETTLKSYMTEYFKMKALGKENPSLEKQLSHYFQQPNLYVYRVKEIIAKLPTLMKESLDKAKDDLPDKADALNAAANSLEGLWPYTAVNFKGRR